MSYLIGSFNLSNFSMYANKDLSQIASYIKMFDIVGLQEVLDSENVIKYRLSPELGDNWGITWALPQLRNNRYYATDSRKEGFAFLWNKKKFSLPKDSYGQEIPPSIYSNYRSKLPLRRDPLYGRFVVNGTNFEIRLINIHITCKTNEKLNKNERELRLDEFKTIASKIYSRINDEMSFVEPVTPYTIILGDYNLNLKASRAGYPYMEDSINIDKNLKVIAEDELLSPCYQLFTTQTDLSTLSSKEDKYTNNFDHFSYDDRTEMSIITDSPHRIEAVAKYCNNFRKYFDCISDHVPIILEIDFRK